jgi:hypothetical protein
VTRVGYAMPGWATGMILMVVNFIVLFAFRLVMARAPLFDDVTPPVMLWWRDWTMLNIVAGIGLLPAVIAGFASGLRLSRTPLFFGLIALGLIWGGFSPFMFRAGNALTTSGDVLVRTGVLKEHTTQWPASSVTVSVSCHYSSGRRSRHGVYMPMYEINFGEGQRVDLNDFKPGTGPYAVDDWIEILAIADDALSKNGARKRVFLTEDDCFSRLLDQSWRDEQLLRIHPYH